MKKANIAGIAASAVIALAMAAPGFSQDQRVEINPFFGYSFSDGVTIDPLVAGGEVWDTVDVKDGAAFGIQFGVYVTENAEVGFLWGRQESTLAGDGTSATDFTSMSVYNYHAVFTYNFGESDAQARPFIMGGLGATQYSPEDAMGTTTARTHTYTKGTLVWDVWDAKEKKLLFQGTGTDTVDANPEKMEKKINKIVEKIVKEFDKKLEKANKQ